MAFKDLREFISLLEERGELRRITVPVSRDLEIAEIADRTVKAGGPALLFENVEGFDMPVAINLFGTHRRMALALGVEDLNELTERVRKILGMLQGPPSGIVDKLRALGAWRMKSPGCCRGSRRCAATIWRAWNRSARACAPSPAQPAGSSPHTAPTNRRNRRCSRFTPH